ncbi:MULTISPECIES: hypothetical protein [Fluviicola]|uniref:hypothetical protein n=1 Tax=Fluviicola TaxID=332102 RepID=UPI0031379905
MRKLLKKPLLFGFLVGLLLLILCVFIPIPMYDGIFHYDYELVHFQVESKVALSYYFGFGLDKTIANGKFPTHFELKPIGYVLFVLIHIGLPSLIAIRLRMGNARKAYVETSSNKQEIESSSNE